MTNKIFLGPEIQHRFSEIYDFEMQLVKEREREESKFPGIMEPSPVARRLEMQVSTRALLSIIERLETRVLELESYHRVQSDGIVEGLPHHTKQTEISPT